MCADLRLRQVDSPSIVTHYWRRILTQFRGDLGERTDGDGMTLKWHIHSSNTDRAALLEQIEAEWDDVGIDFPNTRLTTSWILQNCGSGTSGGRKEKYEYHCLWTAGDRHFLFLFRHDEIVGVEACGSKTDFGIVGKPICLAASTLFPER